MLEALCHESSLFCTLTYAEQFLPPGGSLVPGDMRNFLKRLRHRADCRFYGVGEYGERSERPHYHLILFGLKAEMDWVKGAYVNDDVSKAWSLGGEPIGQVHIGHVTMASARYVAKYTIKGMTRPGSFGDRHPEFARMSLRPGIGASAMHEFASALLDGNVPLDDVPVSAYHGPKSYPLGRYLRGKLRQYAGVSEDGRQPERVQPIEEAWKAQAVPPMFKSKEAREAACAHVEKLVEIYKRSEL